MPAHTDRQRFRNEDLILKVSSAVDRARWDESRYEAFIDELCADREYQKDAIRTTLRWLSALRRARWAASSGRLPPIDNATPCSDRG